MPYVTSIERLAKEEGRQEGGIQTLRDNIQEILAIRFGQVPAGVSEKLSCITDQLTLQRLFRQAMTTSSLESFIHSLFTLNE